jgi:hypothetical protein
MTSQRISLDVSEDAALEAVLLTFDCALTLTAGLAALRLIAAGSRCQRQAGQPNDQCFNKSACSVLPV